MPADIALRRTDRGVFAPAFAPRVKAIPRDLRMPESRGGWYPIVREGFAGAWQQNVDTPIVDVLSHPTVYACVTKISGDIAKMRLPVVEEIGNDVWVPVEHPTFSPALRRPNHYQTPFQWIQSWFISKLTAGNTYNLVQRDGRGVVVAHYVLDPWRVKPLIAPDGSVFYELKPDLLNQVPETPGMSVVVPASEIIHDRMNCLFHPLVGIAPLYAAGIPAILGLKILTTSTHFFVNGQMPGGVLSLPASISKEQAQDYRDTWETQFGGVNAGKIAVLGDGMKFETVGMVNSEQAQLTEQWTAVSEAIANAFGIPSFMVGGPPPPYGNVQAMNVHYLTQTIHPHTKAFEDVYERGVGLAPDKVGGARLGVEFNRNDLLLMDTATQMDAISKGISAGVLAINEGRAQLNLPPLTGGDTPYLQQQNYPLASLADREPPDPEVATTGQPGRPANTMPDEDEMPRAASMVRSFGTHSPVTVHGSERVLKEKDVWALLPAPNPVRALLGLRAI